MEHPAAAGLLGLAVGDAFGSRILLPGDHPAVAGREVPAAPWPWSDDNEMACSMYLVLSRYGEIDQDALAASFAEHFDASIMRVLTVNPGSSSLKFSLVEDGVEIQ